MLYRSTRGKLKKLKFEDVLFSGYLKDGGLALPESVPCLDKNKIRSWSKLSYPELVGELLSLFVSEDELPKTDRCEILSRAYNKFEIPEVIQTHKLKENLYVAELYHGPTLSFKDLALSMIGCLLEYFSEKRKKHLNILVGTSGDTGSAAIECVRGSKWIDIFVLYPKGRCEFLQKLQMITVRDENVTCIEVEKSSDELDVPIRECFADKEFAKFYNLCSINSINWARIMVQIAHYYYLYLLSDPNVEEEVEFIVPTGAGGNVTAGIIAKLMGLPIKLTLAVNTNDIFHRIITSGDMSQKEAQKTFAVAMDIQAPYNIERILHLIGFEDATLVTECMEQFNEKHSVSLPPNVVQRLQHLLRVISVDDDTILKTIKKCWEEFNYVICPHTATAVTSCLSTNYPISATQICLATASPSKFPDTLTAAGIPSDLTLSNKLANLETKFISTKRDDDLLALLKNVVKLKSEKYN